MPITCLSWKLEQCAYIISVSMSFIPPKKSKIPSVMLNMVLHTTGSRKFFLELINRSMSVYFRL